MCRHPVYEFDDYVRRRTVWQTKRFFIDETIITAYIREQRVIMCLKTHYHNQFSDMNAVTTL